MFSLLFLFLWHSQAQNPFNPFGSHNVTQWILGTFSPAPDAIPMQLDVITPTDAGTYPVFVFLSGFSGDIPAYTYQTMLRHISSHGYVVVGLAKFEPIDPFAEAIVLQEVFDWLTANLTQSFLDHGYGTVKPNLNMTCLGAHSSGCHTVVQYINGTCGYVSAMVLYDPVDGGAPYDQNASTIINPPNPVPFVIPTLQTMTGMDPLSLGKFEPACAPYNLSNDRFYYAWQGPIWQINATGYGHGDILDPAIADLIRVVACPGNGTVDYLYRETVAGLTVSFFNSIFNGMTGDLKYLTTPSLLSVDTIMKHDLHGYPSNTSGFCKRTVINKSINKLDRE